MQPAFTKRLCDPKLDKLNLKYLKPKTEDMTTEKNFYIYIGDILLNMKCIP